LSAFHGSIFVFVLTRFSRQRELTFIPRRTGCNPSPTGYQGPGLSQQAWNSIGKHSVSEQHPQHQLSIFILFIFLCLCVVLMLWETQTETLDTGAGKQHSILPVQGQQTCVQKLSLENPCKLVTEAIKLKIKV
jgi:hypothetical protein